MEKTFYLSLFLSIIVTVQCKKDDNNVSSSFDEEATTSIEDVWVKIIADGGGEMANAVVTIANQTAATNVHGYAFFKNVTLSSAGTIVRANHFSYLSNLKRIYPKQGGITFQLLSPYNAKTTGLVTAANGGKISNSDEGWEVNFPVNAFVDENGQAVTGAIIDVKTYYYNPKADNLGWTMPGDLRAYRSDGTPCVLGTYGMLDVEIFDKISQKQVFLKKDVTAIIKLPIHKTQLADAPNQIPQWYFDEKEAVWREDGIAIKQGDFYEMKVSHFTRWNCDQPFNPGHWLEGYVVDNDGTTMVNIMVGITFDNCQIPVLVGANGYFRALMPGNKKLTLTSVHTKNNCATFLNPVTIGTLTSDKNIGNIVLTIISNWITAKGVVVDCNNKPLKNIICSDEISDENGNFQIRFCTLKALPFNTIYFHDLESRTFLKKEFSTPITSDTNLGMVKFCNGQKSPTGKVTTFTSSGTPIVLDITYFGQDDNFYYIGATKGIMGKDTFCDINFQFSYDKLTNKPINTEFHFIKGYNGNQQILFGTGGLSFNGVEYDIFDPINRKFKGGASYKSRYDNTITTILFDIQ